MQGMQMSDMKTDMTAVQAFLEAQRKIKNPTKDSKNPHFKNTYASLETVIESVKSVLNEHGFAVIQECREGRNAGMINVHTTLMHVSGQHLEFAVCVPLGKMDPQGGMGAFTYGRRYGLLAALCLAAEDDDANEASNVNKAADALLKAGNPAVANKPAVSFLTKK
mgnify:CR=1 FL=1